VTVYPSLVRVLAFVMIGLGAAMIVVTASRGGGVGLLLGALFIAAGVGRLIMLRRRSG
jgi:hypothetical protein